MKKTYQELAEIDQAVGIMYQQNPTLKEKKFGYAYQKTAERSYLKLNTQLMNELYDLRFDAAMEDKDTKEVLRDKDNPRGFHFEKEKEKELIKKERKLIEDYNNKEIEFEPYYCAKESLPKLTEYQIELFKGVLFKEK